MTKALARRGGKTKRDTADDPSGIIQLAYEAVTAAYEERWEAFPALIEQADLIADVTSDQLVTLVPEQQRDVFQARDIAATLRKSLEAAARDDIDLAKQWAYCYTYSQLSQRPDQISLSALAKRVYVVTSAGDPLLELIYTPQEETHCV